MHHHSIHFLVFSCLFGRLVCFDKEEKGEGDNSILPTKKMYVSYIQIDLIVNYICFLPVYDGQFAYQPVKSECFFAHWMVFAMCLKWSIFLMCTLQVKLVGDDAVCNSALSVK